MKIAIIFHSTTGNTRLVARYAQAHLQANGQECELVNIVDQPEPPSLKDVDVLGIACPTMNFRPTFSMERYVVRMPNSRIKGMPAFLFGTCAGLPGAHFALLAEQLAYKGYVALGAHWLLAPSNWPVHVALMRRLSWTEGLSPLAAKTPRSWRPLWASLWESCSCPDEEDRQRFEVFLDNMIGRARAGDLAGAPTPRALAVPWGGSHLIGRLVPRDMPDMVLRLRVEEQRCTSCGTCVKVCPEGVVRQTSGNPPVITAGCSGCYACFNHCPEGAIGDALTKAGDGQYKRVPAAMKRLLSGRPVTSPGSRAAASAWG